ncbi:MAG: PH domain-containing protein [Balneolaceae bacterium]|nr:PH domain-containing protein [Balneolaceae bacterium]
MPEQKNQKSIRIDPSWKYHFWGYLLSVLAIPLFGIGLIALYFTRKKHQSRHYIFTDTQISSKGPRIQRNIDLVNIEDVRIEQNWTMRKLGIGDLILQTSASEMMVRGVENPERLKQILEKAIQAEKFRQKEKEKTKPREPEYDPGSMDKMNYLTGLWQQGLISEEDYEKERKHFE